MEEHIVTIEIPTDEECRQKQALDLITTLLLALTDEQRRDLGKRLLQEA